MTLYEAVDKDLIIVPMQASTKDEALRELVGALCRKKNMPGAELLQALQEREKLGSTAIGNAVAIPHCRAGFIEGTSVVIGISRRMIPYDEHEVRIFFLVVANDRMASSHVQLLSSIARFCSSSVNRNLISSAKDPEAVYQTIEN